MTRVCVFCGSSQGDSPVYLDAARGVGRMLAERGLGLVYGGGGIGLMGAVADAAMQAGGEEFFEVWTWAQLKLHDKPCGLLNVAGYFDHLLGFLDTMTAHRFLHDRHRHMIAVAADAADLLDRLQAYAPPVVERWFDKSKT
jgi:predicted Rossmann-fold nucleotide-binding protein